MISWIQRTFQHHFRIVFIGILFVMGVPLVMVYRTGANSDASRRAENREFFGYNLGSLQDQQRLVGDAQMSIQLKFGRADLTEDQVLQYAQRRAAALHLADAWHLPKPTDSQLRDYIRHLPVFADKDGNFDGRIYESFRASVMANPNFSDSDVLRVLSDDIRVSSAERLLGGPGYVLPADIRRQLARFYTTWTIAAAVVDYASYHPDLKPTDTELQRYFSQNVLRYEVPPRVDASYIDFPAADFMRETTASNAAQKLEQAKQLALKAASDFVYSLYDGKVPPGPALDRFAAARNLPLKPLAPFARDEGPAELGRSPEISDAAFQLTTERYYTDALATASGAVVLILRGNEPAHQPVFFEVRAEVLADFVDNEKRQRFVELGRSLRSDIQARLKSGESFAKAAADAAGAAGVKADVKSPAPFTLRSRPADLDATEAEALEHLGKGELSEMAISADKGYLVYALDKKAPDVGESSPQYAEVRAQISAYTAQIGASAELAELVAKELRRTEAAKQ